MIFFLVLAVFYHVIFLVLPNTFGESECIGEHPCRAFPGDPIVGKEILFCYNVLKGFRKRIPILFTSQGGRHVSENTDGNRYAGGM